MSYSVRSSDRRNNDHANLYSAPANDHLAEQPPYVRGQPQDAILVQC